LRLTNGLKSLTSILGSALTLESSGPDLASEDALDLVGRIAANARKLERLLGDLLDLDRLQRGIIAPQRRPTDLASLVARAVAESDDPNGHDIVTEVAPGTFLLDAAKVEGSSRTCCRTPSGTRRRHAHGSEPPRQTAGFLTVEDAAACPEDGRRVFELFRQASPAARAPPGGSTRWSVGSRAAAGRRLRPARAGSAGFLSEA
jgi:hypothetical protein